MTREERLPWNFEAFREYVKYEAIQIAAATFNLFEGETWDSRNPKILKMQQMLEDRSNLNSWVPKRKANEDVNWNVEGVLYRNKGRVFTSLLVLYPQDWVGGVIRLTKFGKALATGQVSEQQFYNHVLSNFQYPHPAWKDNWDIWTTKDRHIKPFTLILEVLIELYELNTDYANLSVNEVADYIHIDPCHKKVKQYVENIIAARTQKTPPKTERSDKIHRKIGDLFGFLCLSGHCFYSSNDRIKLCLLGRHSSERVYFWENRDSQNQLLKLKHLLK